IGYRYVFFNLIKELRTTALKICWKMEDVLHTDAPLDHASIRIFFNQNRIKQLNGDVCRYKWFQQ
ncbi:hypothetical protein S83_048112, partial [Arachis hypogaea]